MELEEGELENIIKNENHIRTQRRKCEKDDRYNMIFMNKSKVKKKKMYKLEQNNLEI